MIFRFPEVYELAIANGIMWIIVGLAVSEPVWLRGVLFFIGLALFVFGVFQSSDNFSVSSKKVS